MRNIGIFGVPRSGTSWLAHIFNSHPDVALRFQPLFSYGHKGSLSTHSSAEEIRTFFKDIFRTEDAFTLMKSEMQKNYPVFKKSPQPTHTIFKETRYLHVVENILTQCSEVRIIGVVRNPLAVLASWVSAPREFNREWNIYSEWRNAPSKNQNRLEEFYGFEKWKEFASACLLFRRQFPHQFLLVRYDELNKRPFDTTKKLFNFSGLEICEQVEDFLIASKSRHDSDPYSVFRAKASDNLWKKALPNEIVKQVASELKHTPLDIFLQDENDIFYI